MKPLYKYILATCLLLPTGVALGQTGKSPKLAVIPNGSEPSSLSRVTNFNPSISLTDTTLAIVADSLRTDGTATIFTVYETDADNLVGLWQVGSGSNRALWLNSQRASYDRFAVTYRKANEHGVVVHSMQYQYPAPDSKYDGRDTLFLGREGDNSGHKNLCAVLYFPGQLDRQYRCQLESALAIRYGAVLHGPYVNSRSETLWNPLADDSLYSVGVCGIGRDDNLSLLQPRSIIRNGIMTIEADRPFSDLEHIMLGSDGGTLDLGDESVLDHSVAYTALDRQWKLRAHIHGRSVPVRLTASLPLPADALRLKLTTDEETTVIAPDASGTFSLELSDGQDCYLSLLVDNSFENGTPESEMLNTAFKYSVSPNPTSGNYTLNVEQSDDDIVNIRVVDANGRIVEQHSSSEPLSQYTYNGHLDADGIYYVTVSSNGRQQTIKLIVVL